MSHLHACLNQTFTPAELADAVRATLGKPLRRAAALTQLTLVGALACLPPERRKLPTLLLWQSTSGPRQETLALLDEMDEGGEPMPYDFLATQPAIASAQIQPYLPGLIAASHCPLNVDGQAHWTTLLMLADRWLAAGRCQQVLCAQLDAWGDEACSHWLLLGDKALDNSPARLHLIESRAEGHPDHPDLPCQLADWLAGETPALRLQAPAGFRQTVEFVRL
ncbi:hypothetical protein [Azonexus sp. IMCC34839]|uniref:hypothetical protein n=1 Tax=Azonexus sp. IMCC34839 TaxID=3133695 RepID=UPI00399999D3